MRLFFRFRDWQGRYPLHCRRLGFTDPDPARDEDKANHTGMVRYGNEPLTLWAACPGMQKPESLATSILAVDWIGGRTEEPVHGVGERTTNTAHHESGVALVSRSTARWRAGCAYVKYDST